MNSTRTDQDGAQRRLPLARLHVPPNRIKRSGDDAPAASLLRFVWRMSGHHQVWLTLIAAFVAALSMAPLELQRRIVNDAVGDGDVSLLIILGAIYLGVILVRVGAKFAMQMYQGWLSESAVRYTRDHLARLVRRADNGAESGEGRGKAVEIIGAELEKLGGFVGEGISQPVVNVGMLVAVLGYMLVVEPVVALVAMAFLLPQIAIVPWLQRMINRLIERRLHLLRSMSDRLSAEGEETGAGRALGDDLDGIYANRMRIFVLKFLMKASTNGLSALAPLTVLVVGGWFVIRDQTTIGVVVAFITGFDRLSNPLRELLAYYRLAAQAVVQHRMIARWMTSTLNVEEQAQERARRAVQEMRDSELGSDDPLDNRG